MRRRFFAAVPALLLAVAAVVLPAAAPAGVPGASAGGYTARPDPWNPQAPAGFDPGVKALSSADQASLNEQAHQLVLRFEALRGATVYALGLDADGTRSGKPYPVTLDPLKALPAGPAALLKGIVCHSGSYVDSNGFTHTGKWCPSVNVDSNGTGCWNYVQAYHYVNGGLADGANFGVDDKFYLQDDDAQGAHYSGTDFSVVGVPSASAQGTPKVTLNGFMHTEPWLGAARWEMRGSDGTLHYSTQESQSVGCKNP